MKKRHVVLMMILCGYVETDSTIRLKIIPCFLWRIINYMLVSFKPGYKDDCIEVLNHIKNMHHSVIF